MNKHREATSKLSNAERAALYGDTIARDIWSAHKSMRSGRLMKCVTDLFSRRVMTLAIRRAALQCLVKLDEEAPDPVTIH